MLVDNIKLLIRAGGGGNGAATFRSDGQTAMGGPDGGNGGKGGDIYFTGSHNLTDLREFRFKKKIIAESGERGARQNMNGKGAADITIIVPWGTRITDMNSGEITEITDSETVHLFAKGGRGGRGNTAFKSSTNQAPRNVELGEKGQERELFLELTLIADIGLIGLPNAGKSSLLTRLTNATPAIGAYPFTTLEPTIGMLDTYPIADVPGLIEGASRGKGLGIEFLRHIEKTKILLHCMDVTSENLKDDYNTIRKEFKAFDAALLEKPEYIVLNKIDLAEPAVVEKAIKLFTKMGKKVFTCSIYQPDQIDALKKNARKITPGIQSTMIKQYPKKEPRIPFTQTGYDELVAERTKLLAQRPEAVENLRKSREMGDLSENGYYKASRAQLSFLDARLRRANRLVKLAVIVAASNNGLIQIGSTVKITDGTRELEFTVVGGYESDPAKHTISHQSPIGRAIMGKKSGDVATVSAPAGMKQYTVVSIT